MFLVSFLKCLKRREVNYVFFLHNNQSYMYGTRRKCFTCSLSMDELSQHEKSKDLFHEKSPLYPCFLDLAKNEMECGTFTLVFKQVQHTSSPLYVAYGGHS